MGPVRRGRTNWPHKASKDIQGTHALHVLAVPRSRGRLHKRPLAPSQVAHSDVVPAQLPPSAAADTAPTASTRSAATARAGTISPAACPAEAAQHARRHRREAGAGSLVARPRAHVRRLVADAQRSRGGFAECGHIGSGIKIVLRRARPCTSLAPRPLRYARAGEKVLEDVTRGLRGAAWLPARAAWAGAP